MPLKVSDGMGAWIDDFQKSDAPQFKGKNKEERREMAIAAYLDAKRGPQKEDVNEKRLMKGIEVDDDTLRMFKANPRMVPNSPAFRRLDPKTQKAVKKHLGMREDVELEENKARQSADLAKAMAAFKKRGGKVKKVAPGKAAGYHGKDDPGAGVHGMMDRPDTKGMPRRKKVRSLRAGVEESVNEEMMFKVSVEGLPPMIMLGRSPGDIKGQLRKIVKQPSMITDVERMTKADVRKRYRDMAKGDGDEEA